jgi:hypothetical protein
MVLGYYSFISFDFGTLTVTFIVLGCINVVKWYCLFDYEVVQVIRNFKEEQEKEVRDRSRNPMQMSRSVSVYIRRNEDELDLEGVQGYNEDERGEG